MSNPHLASDDDDMEALSRACIWMNQSQFAEFWHLNNTTVHLSGRGSEVALNKFKHLSSKTMKELDGDSHVINVFIHRAKNSHEQNLPIFPHRDSFFLDWYFSLIYLIVMFGMIGEYVFPTFAEHALRFKKDNKNDSQVSQHWTTMFTRLFEKCALFGHDLRQIINKKLSSHHGKKRATQVMGESSICSGLAQIFRTGWEVRGFHSIFDYMVGSVRMMKDAGKAVAGWVHKIGEHVLGGKPPSANDIYLHKEEFQLFVDHIFIEDQPDEEGECQISPKVRELLVCSMLRHWDRFIQCLKEHPGGEFEEPWRHLFVARVFGKLRDSGCTPEHFDSWKLQVQRGFKHKNLCALKIRLYDPTIPPSALTEEQREESRPAYFNSVCMLDHVNNLVSCFLSMKSTAETLLAAEAENSRRMSRVETQGQQNGRELLEIKSLLLGRQAVPATPSHRTNEPAGTGPASPSMSQCSVNLFSSSIKGWKEEKTISDRFYNFFVDEVSAIVLQPILYWGSC